MPVYPYFGFPGFYRRNYINNYYSYNKDLNKSDNSSGNNLNSQNSFAVNSSFSNTFSTDNLQNVETSNRSSSSKGARVDNRDYNKKNPDNSCLFELFGLKLYFDDVLIICLLFFLYNEGVKDEGLFIALILLLIS